MFSCLATVPRRSTTTARASVLKRETASAASVEKRIRKDRQEKRMCGVTIANERTGGTSLKLDADHQRGVKGFYTFRIFSMLATEE